MQSIGTEDPKSRQVYVSSLGKNLLREAFLGNNDFTQMQQSIFCPTTPQAQVHFFTSSNRLYWTHYNCLPQRKRIWI